MKASTRKIGKVMGNREAMPGLGVGNRLFGLDCWI